MMTDINDQINNDNTKKKNKSPKSPEVNVVETTTQDTGTDEEPLTPPRTIDYKRGGKYEHVLFGSWDTIRRRLDPNTDVVVSVHTTDSHASAA